MLQEGPNAEVGQGRSEEDRCQVTAIDTLLIILVRGTIEKLQVLLQLIIILEADHVPEARIIH